ncbi:MAG: ATP-binding protein [Opitutales bacterium]|nr:ATP-binding protein [Opitutales bacterium]
MKTSLYGREHELGWLHNRVLRLPGGRNLPALTSLYGPPGIGKTALLGSFVANSLERQMSPTVFFQPDATAGMFGVELFAESMFRSALATPSAWNMAAARLGEQLAQRLAALRRGDAPVAAAYSPQGTIAVSNAGEMAVVGDPRGHQLGELCLEILHSMVERLVQETGSPSRSLSFIFCFDEFADYSPSVKRWLGTVLIQALLRAKELPVPRILLTGRESMESAGQTDYWEVPLSRIDESELLPISRSACIRWLTDQKIDPDLIDEVMEQTKGVPGRIRELIEDGTMLSAMEEKMAKEESGFAISVRQRRWLHAAAVLEYVDKEGLSILLGEREAQAAFQWLREQAESEGITVVDRSELPQIFLSAALKRKILAESSNRYPDRHKDFQTKIAVQQHLQEKVPSLKHREYLKHLIAIEPFDLAMIEKIYGDGE